MIARKNVTAVYHSQTVSIDYNTLDARLTITINGVTCNFPVDTADQVQKTIYTLKEAAEELLCLPGDCITGLAGLPWPV